MVGLQSGEGRTMIDSVVWVQYINVTDKHTDSHVAIALRRAAKTALIVESQDQMSAKHLKAMIPVE